MTGRRPERTPPRPACGWIAVACTVIAAAFVWVGWSFARPAVEGSPGAPRWSVLLFVACWLLLGVVSVGGLLIQASTRLDEASVSQLSPAGRVVVTWARVESVERSAMGILTISDGRRTITVAAFVYPDADRLYTWIRERLRGVDGRT